MGELPADVGHMTAQGKPRARPVRGKSTVYPPQKAAWLAEDVGKPATAGMVCRSDHGVNGSVEMTTPKGQGKSSYLAVNATIE